MTLRPQRPTRMTHDQIIDRMRQVRLDYGDGDRAALEEMLRRISVAGATRSLLTYSDLVRGIEFRLANVNGGMAFSIDVHSWQGLDRRIVGDFLASVCQRTYATGGFMGSALVVDKNQSMPSRFFFEWMETLKVLPNLDEMTVLAFWADQVRIAHDYYTRQSIR